MNEIIKFGAKRDNGTFHHIFLLLVVLFLLLLCGPELARPLLLKSAKKIKMKINRYRNLLWYRPEVYKFSKNLEAVSNSRHQKDDMKKVPYRGPTNIRHHPPKCSHPCNLVPRICESPHSGSQSITCIQPGSVVSASDSASKDE
jgi:hypothetical protein